MSDFENATAGLRHAITPKQPRPKKCSKPTKVEIDTCPQDFARSHIANHSPQLPVISEREAIQRLKETWTDGSDDMSYDGYQSKKPVRIIDLHDFEIYRTPQSSFDRQYELVCLHLLEVPRRKQLCFDGCLRIGSTVHHLQSISIHDTSIEGYGNKIDPSVTAYIQSPFACHDAEYDVWYKLHKPNSGYKRFHKPFLWVAQLAKHVIDYVEEQPAESVGLERFKGEFQRWVTRRFAHQKDFKKWRRSLYDRVDFRVAVHAHIEYIFRQAINLPNSEHLLTQPLWGDCLVGGMNRIEAEEQVEKDTIVTPHVENCFSGSHFRGNLKRAEPSELVQAEQTRRKYQLGFPEHHFGPTSTQTNAKSSCRPYGNALVKVGDVIALDPQNNDKLLWKNANSEWLAYVQGAELLEDKTQRLSVIWLYQPSETHISKAKYPFENELFFSDNCNCGDGELLSKDIKGRYRVQWLPKVIDNTNFFIRQTYVTQDSAFISHQDEHKTCMHKKIEPSILAELRSRDTVYVEKTFNEQKILEPFIIRKIDRSSNIVTVQKLERLYRDCSELAAKAGRKEIAHNELVLTDKHEEVSAERIKRRCSVRFIPKEHLLKGLVPFPYNMDGAGDFWFLSMHLAGAGSEQCLSFCSSAPKAFREGLDLAQTSPMLRGLSIFSGGGSLDRGLEEGGAVQFEYAVDIDPHAMHTQRANSKNPNMQFFCGSVDDYLRLALSGDRRYRLIARIGDVDLIAAGSPCPGFSTLQRDFWSPQSLRNASHITTFCSFVDLYRPQYAILENVVAMASTRKDLEEDQNVLLQLVACLVSIGYQVTQYIMDAWSYGSAQQRSRVFLSIAAPGLRPIKQPLHTHSMPYEETAGRSLGKLPSGGRFGEREHYTTPFSHVTAGDITSTLPKIGNGQVHTCIAFPDHRLSTSYPPKERALLKYIPRDPPGCGYKDAARLDIIPPLLQKPKKDFGKAYTRIKKNGLIPTITTSVSIQNSHNGACVHYDEHRSITILDARRAQGLPDNEPIIGTPADQYRIIGNGVDRKVAFALGLALLHAIQKNLQETHSPNPQTTILGESSDNPIEIENDDSDAESVESLVYIKTSPATIRPHIRSDSFTMIPQRRSVHVVVESRSSATLRTTAQSSPNTNTTPLPTSLLSRLSLSPTMSAKPRSLLLPSRIETTLVRRKRRIEEIHEDMASSDILGFYDAQPRPMKRSNRSTIGQTLETTVETSMSRAHWSSSSAGNNLTRNRQTRHSNLSIEFAPRQWNKRPEEEYKGK